MSNSSQEQPIPKAFISYAWSSEDHKQKVLDLAKQLRDDGVDVRLDRWHLREGDDANAFMESMISDPDISRVMLIFDKVYVEKADGRCGGVGKETQIVTPAVYNQVRYEGKPNKFVGVVFEYGPDGKPYVPVYYGDRIFIDLSAADRYAECYVQLVRWIYGEAADVAPLLGPRPVFAQPDVVATPSALVVSRVQQQIRSLTPQAPGALSSFLDDLASNFNKLRPTKLTVNELVPHFEFAMTASLPLKNNFVAVLITLAQAGTAQSHVDTFTKFFEKMLDQTQAPPDMNAYLSSQYDSCKFLAHELFITFAAIMLDFRQYEFLERVLTSGLYAEEYLHRNGRPGLLSYAEFCADIPTIQHINNNASQKFYSLQGKMLSDRCEHSGVNFEKIIQADLCLHLRSAMLEQSDDEHRRWYMTTHPWLAYKHRPLEMFARAESISFFNRISPILAISDPQTFRVLVAKLSQVRWQHQFNLPTVTGSERIATRP